MTSSHSPTKVGGFQRAGCTRKPFYLNYFGLARHEKFNVGFAIRAPANKEKTTFLCGGGHFDQERISALQSNEIQLRCENSDVATPDEILPHLADGLDSCSKKITRKNCEKAMKLLLKNYEQFEETL